MLWITLALSAILLRLGHDFGARPPTSREVQSEGNLTRRLQTDRECLANVMTAVENGFRLAQDWRRNRR